MRQSSCTFATNLRRHKNPRACHRISPLLLSYPSCIVEETVAAIDVAIGQCDYQAILHIFNNWLWNRLGTGERRSVASHFIQRVKNIIINNPSLYSGISCFPFWFVPTVLLLFRDDGHGPDRLGLRARRRRRFTCSRRPVHDVANVPLEQLVKSGRVGPSR
jgi:hypothetical protein